ncbi:MAG: TRAP transporter substrate-binding protein [Pseudomonadota bacterium]
MERSTLYSVLTAGLLMGGSTLQALSAEVTLTLSHFLSPQSSTHVNFLQPWAERVEEQSDGRIEVKIFPSMTLGGKPPELYSQVRDGAADIAWTLPGYTPGVFPRSEVFELPTVHTSSATTTTLAIQDVMDDIAADFDDVKLILLHAHAGQALHLTDGCVEGLDGFDGLKLRTPSRTGGWMIEALGAEPVGMPVPALTQALANGGVDGALIPFEVMPPLKVQELTECSMTGVADTRFGTALFMFAMNKSRYDALPDDLKAVIDANSGANIADFAGGVWDNSEQIGKDAQIGTGSPINEFSADVTEEITSVLGAVVDRWVEDVSAQGIDGENLVKKARAAIAARGTM